MNDPHRLIHLAQELEQELQKVKLATKDDLDAMEKRLSELIKGKPADLSKLVEKGNALMAETDALEKAVNQNQSRLKETSTMATAADQIATLTTQVTTATTVEKSAQTLIEGIQARIDAAVSAAIANGATAEQLQPVSDLSAAMDAESTALQAAVTANTGK